MQEAYRVLGLQNGASQDEVRLAYRTLAKCWHPDRHAGKRTAGEALRRMQEINAAYETLCQIFREQECASPAAKPSPVLEQAASPHGDSCQAVRALLSALLPVEAEAMLRRMGLRDAETHHLYALCRFRRGDFVGALKAARIAQQFDPGSAETASLIRKLEALQPKHTPWRQWFAGKSS